MELNTDQMVDVSIGITDARGRPARVDGAPSWEATVPGIVNVNVAADGMSASVEGIDGVTGTTKVRITGDADLGTGVVPIIGESEDINVVLGPSTNAANVGITFGTPQDKP